MIGPFDEKEVYLCGYQDGVKEARMVLGNELYTSIALYLDAVGVDLAEEKADYVCQIIKGMTVSEILGD